MKPRDETSARCFHVEGRLGKKWRQAGEAAARQQSAWQAGRRDTQRVQEGCEG